MDGLCMHVLFDLTTKIIAEYLRTYVANFRWHDTYVSH
jgi:hypothetical protein